MDRFDIVEGYYWFYADYHGGQACPFYERMCRISDSSGKIQYSPGAHQNGPDTEGGMMVYEALKERHGYTE